MKKLILLGTIIVSLALKAGYLEEGKLYYANKNYLKAEEMFLKAVQEGNVEGMNYLGNLYYKQEKYDKAEQIYLSAVEKGNDNAMKDLAMLYEDQKNLIKLKRCI